MKDLLAQGFIQCSTRPCSASILFVTEKDGRWRMCINYMALNKQTIKDQFLLPSIAMEETSIQKIAFCTNRGHFEFLVMPFGLSNAPATFQRLMNKVFVDSIGKFIAIYVDDMLVLNQNLDKHW